MLFPYTYVPHQMEKMQEFIDFIFFTVWCKARTRGNYGMHLFAANAKLHAVVESFHYSDTKGADFFNRSLESIYNTFKALSPRAIRQLRRWYKGNNDVERVCANDPRVHLARYADIKVEYPQLAEQLETFFKGLYERLDIAALKGKIGDIDAHYKAFVETNKVGKCPFCGMNDLLGEYHSTREAYDHYLPKAIYPFNSISFKNLVPACHHCNSNYKTSKDPAYTPKDPTRAIQRRPIFYPYTATPYVIELQVALQHSDVANLTPADITLQFGPATLRERIDTWKDVYNIEERYKAKLCGENDGKYWMTQVLDECHAYEKQPVDILTMRTQQAESRPFADCNFLRKPFLDACEKIGLFNGVE